MTFSSPAVFVEWNRDNLVLRPSLSAPNSLVISAEHIRELRLKEDAEFDPFFLETALQNRTARRMFAALSKKDPQLLAKLRQEIRS